MQSITIQSPRQLGQLQVPQSQFSQRQQVSPASSASSSPGLYGESEQQLAGMQPIQPMFSNQSYQSFESSSHPQNSETGNISNNHSGTKGYSADGIAHSASQEKGGKGRRWSLAGRFFEKRKSVTEPFHIPGSHPQNFAATYNSSNSNIVFDGQSNQDHHHHHHHHHHHKDQENNGSKQPSPPGSNGSSRRSSLVEIPRAFLSSLRRGSLTGSIDSQGSKASTSSMADQEKDGDKEVVIDENATTLMNGQPHAIMAAPKAPPKDPWTLAHSQPPKSILKKRNVEGQGSAGKTPGAGAGGHNGVLDSSSNGTSSILSPDVHPMATSGEVDIDKLAPIDHRARLLTHSPIPNHSQQQHAMLSPIPPPSSSSSPSSNSSAENDNNTLKLPRQIGDQNGDMSTAMAMSMSIPPDMSPGVQSNSTKDHGNGNLLPISSRAQALASQYYGPQQVKPQQQGYNMAAGTINGQGMVNLGGGPSSGSFDSMYTMTSGGNSLGSSNDHGRRRSINFLETVEIIPAHRKSDYNRQSDKHATFKILTPDLKSEIRDELNTYKMREMAVHVESMGNTAFH
ncbi:hypothetical protein BGZ94_001589 [Podila epigama]|nr:hypothetical protein BGZ94_001589 [Podila epigama]